MALTTVAKGDVVEDVRPTDINANVQVGEGKPRMVSHELAVLLDKSVVARPLMTPEVCSIHVKNTEYAYRWVNHDSQNGRFFNMRRSQGFTNATPNDVDVMGGDAAVDNGTIRAGDLILMKIRADIYDAAIKHNAEKAMVLMRARGIYMEGGSSDVMSDDTPSRKTVAAEPYNSRNKTEAFIPANADALVNDSVLSGRVNAAREAVDNLRAAQKT